MKDFRLFDIYDFLVDEDFIRWVKEKRKSDNDFWNNWLAQNPTKHIIIAEAKRILESFGAESTSINEEEKKIEIDKLLSIITREPDQQQVISPVRKVFNLKSRWFAAAGVLLFVAAGAFVYLMVKTGPAPTKFDYLSITTSKRLVENVNTSEKPVNLKLPDGSDVELSSNSRISYPNNFDSATTRDVYLSGEALFTVTKNPSRPFRVFSNEIVTKVLGTSFKVSSFEKDSSIRVVVKTGKVSVYSQASSSITETAVPNKLGGIILAPNQELVYQKAKQKFQKILLDNPAMIVSASEDKTLLYDDASLEKVFGQLEKLYGINIVYDSETLKNCTITADLRTVSFYDKVELTCKAVGANYEIIDGQVVIQASGCD